MEKSNNLGNLGYPTVQDYVVDNFGKDVLDRIYSDLSLNEWDYFVCIDSKYELDGYVENFL